MPYILFVFLIPNLAVTVRRLHDIGKSGWMILISIIPIIGANLVSRAFVSLTVILVKMNMDKTQKKNSSM